MKRGGPLKRTKGLKRGGPLRRESAKRRAERPLRDEVRRRALDRAGRRCQMAEAVPEVKCWGVLEVDEIVGRGVRPGAHLEVDITQVGCQAHHHWKTSNPAEARRRGLRLESWEGPPRAS